jgi:hypothetical protein
MIRNAGRMKQTPAMIPTGEASLRVTDKYTELGGAWPRQHIDQRQAFDELLLGNPAALFLNLGLHDAHDGGAAVAHGADLEKDTGNFCRSNGSFAHFGSSLAHFTGS